MSSKIAVVLPENLSEKVEKLQKELELASPGEVILRALSLLELSMGRKVELKDSNQTLEINEFKKLRQSIQISDNNHD